MISKSFCFFYLIGVESLLSRWLAVPSNEIKGFGGLLFRAGSDTVCGAAWKAVSCCCWQSCGVIKAERWKQTAGHLAVWHWRPELQSHRGHFKKRYVTTTEDFLIFLYAHLRNILLGGFPVTTNFGDFFSPLRPSSSNDLLDATPRSPFLSVTLRLLL